MRESWDQCCKNQQSFPLLESDITNRINNHPQLHVPLTLRNISAIVSKKLWSKYHTSGFLASSSNGIAKLLVTSHLLESKETKEWKLFSRKKDTLRLENYSLPPFVRFSEEDTNNTVPCILCNSVVVINRAQQYEGMNHYRRWGSHLIFQNERKEILL